MGINTSHHKYESYYNASTNATNSSTNNSSTNDSSTNITKNKGRALLVAISYSKTSSPLPGTQQDKILVEDTIKNKGFSDIVVMTDKDVPSTSPRFPTKQNILRALRWLLSSSSIEDFDNPEINEFAPIQNNQLTFFYYSGHGSQVTDYSGDEKDGKDEVICPITESGGWDPEDIKDDTLLELINQHTNSSTILLTVLDCCHSGTGLDLCYRLTNGYVYKYDQAPPTKCPIILISGSRDYQYSHEGSVGGGKVHGYLTWAWCSSMNYKSNQSLFALERSINQKVAKLISSSRQMPTFSLGKSLPISYQYPI
jgi:hypothetical protein